MKKIIFNLIAGCIMASSFSSCNLFGLDLQKDFEYEYTPVELTMDMTAYEFIKTRKDIDMTLLNEAIEKAGYKDEYETPDRTFIILNDAAWASYLKGKQYNSVQEIPVDEIKTLLNYNIIQGRFHSLDLTTSPLLVETLRSEMPMYLSLKIVAAGLQDNHRVQINNFSNSNRIIEVVTSNLQPTNGIMHVVDNYPEYLEKK